MLRALEARGVRRPPTRRRAARHAGAARPRAPGRSTWPRSSASAPAGASAACRSTATPLMNHASAEAAAARGGRGRRGGGRGVRRHGAARLLRHAPARPPRRAEAADGLLPLRQRGDRRRATRSARTGSAAWRSSTSTSTTATAPRPAWRTTRRSSTPPATNGPATPAPAIPRSGAPGQRLQRHPAARRGRRRLPRGVARHAAPGARRLRARPRRGLRRLRRPPRPTRSPSSAWTSRDYVWLTERICEAAERHCGGRVVSLLEGGYDLDALANSAAAHVRCLMRG